jgi:hypothetical protein
MWQNNGFGNNGQFQNGFNSQESYPPSPFGPSSGPPLAGQQYFPNQQNLMQYEDANGEGFINNDFQPEVGLYNEGAFMQNQFINANTQVCFVEPGHYLTLCTTRKARCCFESNRFEHLQPSKTFSLTFLCMASSPHRTSIYPQQLTLPLLDLSHR